MRSTVLVCLSAACHAQYGAAPAMAYQPAAHVAVAAYSEAEALHIHPSCNSGGPTAGYEGYEPAASSEYRKRTLRSDRTLFEDDLEEPYDDPGCGHGICVEAPGGHNECICDVDFMTTPEAGPCGQRQKWQGTAFILQLFMGCVGAGSFYLGGGWYASGILCLLFGFFGIFVGPVLACFFQGVFNCIFCCPRRTPGVGTCAGPSCLGLTAVLHCAAVIIWFVSLIEIAVDCKVHGIPCVPM